jgi:DNA-binding Lrp family transcriptional regulator
MNELQKKILNVMQAYFPIVQRPYAEMARGLNCEEQEILEQAAGLKQAGIIRRIGAIFDAAHLGYSSTLVAAQVPEVKVEAFVDAANKLAGVSHNYGRAHAFNVWFTLTVPRLPMIEDIIRQLRNDFGVKEIYSLPAERLFKIQVDFDFENNGTKAAYEVKPPLSRNAVDSGPAFSRQQMELIRQLQEDMAVVSSPFDAISEQISMPVEDMLTQIRQWKESGVIRRFGASLRHQKAGFTVNGMVVFSVAEEQIEASGKDLACFGQVSHCYQRPTAKGWPYNLFAMTHCRTKEELKKTVEQMVEKVRPIQYDVLQTTAEYKKTNVKYFVEQE